MLNEFFTLLQHTHTHTHTQAFLREYDVSVSTSAMCAYQLLAYLPLCAVRDLKYFCLTVSPSPPPTTSCYYRVLLHPVTKPTTSEPREPEPVKNEGKRIKTNNVTI